MRLEMKSKITKTADMDSVDLSQFAVEVVIDRQRQEQEMLKLRRKHAKKECVEDVQKEDIVTVDLTSENNRFNRKGMILNIGLNLFDKELEAKLCGQKVGIKTTIQIGGTQVEATVLKSERMILPEVDENLAAICEVSSVEELWDQCKNAQFQEELEDAVDEALVYMAKWVSKNFKFEIDEEEQKLCLMRVNGMYVSMLENNGVTAESATPEVLEKLFEVQTLEELNKNALETASQILKLAVVGEYLAKKEGKYLTTEEYDEHIRIFAEGNECDTDSAITQNPIGLYICDEYSNFFFETMEKSVFSKLSVISR